MTFLAALLLLCLLLALLLSLLSFPLPELSTGLAYGLRAMAFVVDR